MLSAFPTWQVDCMHIIFFFFWEITGIHVCGPSKIKSIEPWQYCFTSLWQFLIKTVNVLEQVFCYLIIAEALGLVTNYVGNINSFS